MILVHGLDEDFVPGYVPHDGRTVLLDAVKNEAWARTIIDDPEQMAEALIPLYYQAMRRYDDAAIATAVKKVTKLSKRLRPYPAEQRLFELLQETIAAEDWRDHELATCVYVTYGYPSPRSGASERLVDLLRAPGRGCGGG